LEDKLRTLIAFEYSPFTRVVFRPIKDLVLKLVNYVSNRNLTIAISNLGKVTFPDPIDGYIDKCISTLQRSVRNFAPSAMGNI